MVASIGGGRNGRVHLPTTRIKAQHMLTLVHRTDPLTLRYSPLYAVSFRHIKALEKLGAPPTAPAKRSKRSPNGGLLSFLVKNVISQLSLSQKPVDTRQIRMLSGFVFRSIFFTISESATGLIILNPPKPSPHYPHSDNHLTFLCKLKHLGLYLIIIKKACV